MKIGQVEVTEEQMERLVSSCYMTWDYLSADAGPCKKSVIVELCLDANRLRAYPANDVESDELVGKICKDPGGYPALARAVSRRFNP